MLRQTHCHVSFTRLVISSSNNKLYSLLYIRELNSHVNECPGGNLIWARMSGVVIWCEHECPGLSFDVSTNVRGGHLMWARMSGVVIWCEHECPALSKLAWERMSVGTNVRTPKPVTVNLGNVLLSQAMQLSHWLKDITIRVAVNTNINSWPQTVRAFFMCPPLALVTLNPFFSGYTVAVSINA